MDEEDLPQAALRSVNSEQQTHVNFINRTCADVRSWWLDFNGQPVSYGDIKPGRVLPMMTYLMYSLQQLSLMAVRCLVKEQDFVRLEIPTELQHELRQTPDLRRDLLELNTLID